MFCLVSTLFLSDPAFAATLGSQTITTSTTPTALTCSGQRYVNKLTVRVLPGFAGKVFVGISGMNTSSYANTLKVLFPNGGAHSEEYTIQDPSGDDGVDLCGIYVAGGIGGENAVAEYESNTPGGTLAPTYILQPFYVKAISNATLTSSLASGTYGYTVLTVGIIPGNSGKQTITYVATAATPFTPTATGEAAVLYPNTGTLSQHSAWSESWSIINPFPYNDLAIGIVPNTSGLGYADFQITPQIAGEEALVAIWRKATPPGVGGGVPYPPSGRVLFNSKQQTLGTSTTAAVFPTTTNIGMYAKIRQIPGYGTKTYITDCFGNPTRTLYPNNTGSLGFSEELDFGKLPVKLADPVSHFQQFCAYSDAASAVDVNYVSLTDPAEGVYSGPPPTSQVSGSLVPVSAGSSIGRGNVSHLLVSVTAGQTGKMYIGSSTMNTSTLAGVYAILYPNSMGRWSETFELIDEVGNGIPSSNLYVKAQISGESVLVFSVITSQADGPLSVVASGPLAGAFSSYGVPFASSSVPFTILRSQAIPGGSGKAWVGTSLMTAAQPDSTYANVLKVLWPSQGNYNVGEGFSEKFTADCSGTSSNCLNLTSYKFWPYISSEQLLVFALGR